MKITSLYLKDFLGVQQISIDTPQPVQLFAGGNAAGKSSIRDAVALAITGHLPRIALKKEVAELVRAGASGADCEVHAGDEVYSFGISAGGKLAQPKNLKPELSFVVEAQRFTQLSPDERRAFLFELMRVKLAPADIVAELTKAGHDKVHVEVIKPLLRTGFEDAAKEAKTRATACKGAWKQITGEQFGSEKGKDWKAPMPGANPELITKLNTELKHADAALATWNEQKGKLKADADYRAQRAASLAPLREKVALEQRIRDKLATDEAELERLKPLLEHAAGSAPGAARVGIQHDLAKALAALLKIVVDFDLTDDEKPAFQHAQLTLANYEAQFGRLTGAGDPDAAHRAARLREAITTCESAISHDKRDLNAALEAKAQIVHIEAELGQPFDADALAECDRQIAEITAKRAESTASLERERNLKDAADKAEEKTRDAAARHADVMAWDALGDELSPSGLPARLLARAMVPINERLDTSSADAGWPRVEIDEHMTVRADERDYRLLSVSERWRVDAMVAEAISHLSGAKLLMLDGFDVLEPAARGALVAWLDVMVENCEIDTALIFGTLKEAPKGMPETIGVHWLTGGVVLHNVKEAA